MINNIVENLTGMNKMTDQVIATDFLISAKSGIKSISIALSETAWRVFIRRVNVKRMVALA